MADGWTGKLKSRRKEAFFLLLCAGIGCLVVFAFGCDITAVIDAKTILQVNGVFLAISLTIYNVTLNTLEKIHGRLEKREASTPDKLRMITLHMRRYLKEMKEAVLFLAVMMPASLSVYVMEKQINAPSFLIFEDWYCATVIGLLALAAFDLISSSFRVADFLLLLFDKEE